MSDNNHTCFVIMPITTPPEKVEIYQNDELHFKHTLEHLFIPAIEEAGFKPISPKSTGSNIIHADIINNLSTSDLVLCDMSILNPNVFFEFGIRTALDKPVALVVDDLTSKLPFDTSIINFHKYNHCLDPWILKKEISDLKMHITDAYKKSNNQNSLWKYFGIKQSGSYSPEDVEIGEKLDLIMSEITALRETSQLSSTSFETIPVQSDFLNDFQERVNILKEYNDLEQRKKLLEFQLDIETQKNEPNEPDETMILMLQRKLRNINRQLKLIDARTHTLLDK